MSTPNYKILSDPDLISLLREGNHVAYTEIYKRYKCLLITFALKKLKDEELAKDIVQEVFISLWEKRMSFNNINNIPAYLITITKRKILDLFDHEKVKSNYASSLAQYSLNNHISDTDHHIREKQLNDHIISLVNAMPKKMRQSFELSRFNNLSNKEIANKLETSDNNVSQHINNAVRILKAKLISLL